MEERQYRKAMRELAGAKPISLCSLLAGGATRGLKPEAGPDGVVKGAVYHPWQSLTVLKIAT